MRRLLLILILCLWATSAFAGAEIFFFGGTTCGPVTASTINGISALSDSSITDTGTGCASFDGTVTVNATCETSGGGADVYLVVDGAVKDTLSCVDFSSDSAALTYSGTGSTIRIYGTTSGDGTFAADTFSIHIP